MPLPGLHHLSRHYLSGAVQGKPHWRLGEEELSLFEGDRTALQALPPQELSCVRWEQRKCNKQGVLTLAGIHRYSAGPDWAQSSVTCNRVATRPRGRLRSMHATQLS